MTTNLRSILKNLPPLSIKSFAAFSRPFFRFDILPAPLVQRVQPKNAPIRRRPHYPWQ